MNEEEILDIKRENYKLRKENFELIQDNNKLQGEKDILNLKLREEICKSACSISKIKTKIRDKIKELEKMRDTSITSETFNIFNGEIIVLKELLEE